MCHLSVLPPKQHKIPFDKVAGGVVNSAIALAAARGIQKSTGSGQLNALGRGGQSRSRNTWAL